MDSVNFSELTTVELDALAAGPRVLVLLLPVGTVEPHGPHAPLGTDVLIASAICRRTAEALASDERVRALVLPAIPFGVTRYAAAFRGAIDITPDTLTALIREVHESLTRDGFRHLVLVNHHFEPEHIAALRGLDIPLFDITRRTLATRLTDEFRRGSCHAGSYETSLVLSEQPELVDGPAAAALPAYEVNMPSAIAEGRTDFLAMGMEQAYCGAPAEASAEEGEQTYSALVEMLSEVVRALADAG